MSISLSEEDHKAIAAEVANKLTAENPGVLVTRQACNDRYEAMKTIVQHICTLSHIELAGVIVTVVGIVVTVLLIAFKG